MKGCRPLTEDEIQIISRSFEEFFDVMRPGLLKIRALINVIGQYKTGGDFLPDGADVETHRWSADVVAEFVDEMLEELNRVSERTDEAQEGAR